jgi:hypothetical protein
MGSALQETEYPDTNTVFSPEFVKQGGIVDAIPMDYPEFTKLS